MKFERKSNGVTIKTDGIHLVITPEELININKPYTVEAAMRGQHVNLPSSGWFISTSVEWTEETTWNNELKVIYMPWDTFADVFELC